MKTTYVSIDGVADYLNEQLAALDRTASAGGRNEEELLGQVGSAIDAACHMLRRHDEELAYDTEALKAVRNEFRRRTDHFISRSYFARRTRTWPQGYQGDYKTLETIYRNTPLSDGVGYYIDRYGLSNPLAEAVRNRIRLLQDFLRDELISRQRPRVLNLACGSCRELMEITTEIRAAKARITCLDDDSDALNFSLNRLSMTDAAPHVKFLRYNVLRMFDQDSNLREFGKQDIIYSVGLFDYLPTDFLITLINALYGLLNDGGTLIMAFKDAGAYDATLFHWIADWDGFRQRTGPEFDAILASAGIPSGTVRSMKDDTGIISFYKVKKRG